MKTTHGDCFEVNGVEIEEKKEEQMFNGKMANQ